MKKRFSSERERGERVNKFLNFPRDFQNRDENPSQLFIAFFKETE